MYLKEGSPSALSRLHNGQVLLNAGFTTMREVGNEADYACSDLKKAITQAGFDGPTLTSARAKSSRPFGGHPRACRKRSAAFGCMNILTPTSPDEIRKAIHQNIYYGAGVFHQTRHGQQRLFLYREEIRAAAD